jgi:CheY-specific phosphatase CheX
MPSTEGLFHRASAQWGGDAPDAEQSKEFAGRICADLGVRDIATLQKMEWSRLNEIGNAVAVKMAATLANFAVQAIPAGPD